MVITTLDIFLYDKDKPLDAKQMSLLQFEAKRINENPIQLLALYKSENNLLASHIDEHDVEEFLDELIARENNIAEAKGIILSVDCDSGLMGYFDIDLITGVLSNAIHNAIRHTTDAIRVAAREGDDNSLVIQVIDNGPGIQEALLPDRSPEPDTIDYNHGGTGTRPALL